MPRIEQTALSNLIHNEEYTRKVLPFIKEEYFADKLEGLLFSEIYRFVDKYNNLPLPQTKTATYTYKGAYGYESTWYLIFLIFILKSHHV